MINMKTELNGSYINNINLWPLNRYHNLPSDNSNTRSWPFHTHIPEIVELLFSPKRHTDEKAFFRSLSNLWNIPKIYDLRLVYYLILRREYSILD